jgi:hypothetical protein
LLALSRKEISKKVRATITGGDVLQIEDFQIDMNEVKILPRLSKKDVENKKQAFKASIVKGKAGGS